MGYLNTKAAGAVIGVSDSTIRRLIAEGEIKWINVGSADRPRIRITEDELHRFMQSRAASQGAA